MLDRAGFEKLESLSREVDGPDLRDIAGAVLSGELSVDVSLPRRALRRLGNELRRGLLDALSALAAPVLATLALQMLLDRTDGALRLLCRLACACALAQRSVEAIRCAAAAMSASSKVADAASPVIAAVLAMTGAGASSALMSPTASLVVSFIEDALLRWGIPLCAVAAVVATCGSLSDRFRLDRLFALLCRTAVWGVRGLIAAFVALLALEGRLAAAQDTASAHAVGQALRGIIPLIGRSVSDSTGMLMETAAKVRSAAGVTGVILALGVCARPALRLAAHMLSLRLAAAILEPVADRGITRIAAGFADIARTLLAMCVGSALLTALLAGVCLGVA